LRADAPVRSEHVEKGGVVVRGAAVVLDDLAALPYLERDRLRAKVDRPLVADRTDARRQRLVRNGKAVAVPQRDTARFGVAEQPLQES
jgi:hypothetical protein